MASAYLNADGDVMAIAKNSDPDVSEVQYKTPEVIEKITNAPTGLKPFRYTDPHPKATEYHRKTSGDGTDINHYTLMPDLEAYKSRRFVLIDRKTQKLISHGFEFDGNRFSMSPSAQITWNTLRTSILAGMLTSIDFPRYLSTADNQTYILQNIPDANDFFAAYADMVSYRLNTGRDLKNQIMISSSKEEIDNIIDDREESDEPTSTVANKRVDAATSGYVDWRYEVVENSGGKTESIKRYMTDNGDGTYSGLVKEDLYEYKGNKLISITVNSYDSDANIQVTEKKTFHASKKSAIRKYS